VVPTPLSLAQPPDDVRGFRGIDPPMSRCRDGPAKGRPRRTLILVSTSASRREKPRGEKNRSETEEELFTRLEDRLTSVGILLDTRRMRGPTERSMLRTLAMRERPLLDPEQFDRAHRGLARALEAMMVNAREAPSLSPRLGPLRPLTVPIVVMVANWIQANQTKDVVQHVRRLYALREANSVWNSPEHVLLRRARTQMQVISEASSSTLGLPIFLLSGAFVSGLVSILRGVVVPALDNWILTTLLMVVTVSLLVGIGAMFLQGAAVAKARLRLALKAPLETLYASIGATGSPPRDKCFQVAMVALAIFAIAVILIPGGVFLILHG